MTKAEVFELMTFLNESYTGFTITQSKIDSWAKLFKDQDFGRVMAAAERHVVHSKFPPAIAELIHADDPAATNVPDLEATKQYIAHKEQEKEQGAYGDHPARIQALKRIREVLDIDKPND